jgi:lipoate-protein ligase A
MVRSASVGEPAVWRFIDLGPQDVYEANARMPLLCRAVMEGSGPVMTTSVWGDTHLDMGWFDDVDVWVDLEACRTLGVEVIRRPMYGGGTAFYDKGCACMWGWLLPKDEYPDLDAALAGFRPIFEDCLARLGLDEVKFEGSMDLRWRGRKLGAMPGQDVIACNSVGGFINLTAPDLDLYLKVGRVPEEKFKDKLVKDMREYVVSASEIRGTPLAYEEFRDALVGACRSAGLELDPSPLTEDERTRGIEKVRARIGSDDHIRRVSSARFRSAAPNGARVGFGNHKGRKLCRAGVALDGHDVVLAAMLAGDMHVSPPDVLDRVAAGLVGADAGDRADLRARIAEVFEAPDVHQGDATLGVTTDDLLAAVEAAAAVADAEATA